MKEVTLKFNTFFLTLGKPMTTVNNKQWAFQCK